MRFRDHAGPSDSETGAHPGRARLDRFLRRGAELAVAGLIGTGTYEAARHVVALLLG